MSLALGAGIDVWRGAPVRAARPLSAPPAMLRPPFVTGTAAGKGRIGTPLGLDPGRWAGEPAPALAVQWRRGEADIPGATGLSYLPAPADDGAALSARVTARNSFGAAAAQSAAVAVTTHRPSPQAACRTSPSRRTREFTW